MNRFPTSTRRLPTLSSSPPPAVARLGTRIALAGFVLLATASPTAHAATSDYARPESPFAAPAQDYSLEAHDATPPADIDAAVRAHVAETALRVSTADGEPIMDIWFARELPAPSDPPVDPAVAYGSMNEGVVLAAMHLHREHRDFRDQAVPEGTYVARYLRQPNDGNHLGETTYRDFAVLVPSSSATSPAPQRFDVTLGQALQLNTHPFVWGLWPADYVVTAEQPGIAPVDGDKWAIKLELARVDGSTQPLALVVVGNERHYY